MRADPARVADVRALLSRWREQSGPSRSDRYWDEWERLLTLPIDEFERFICAENERATVLRSVSPIGVLISVKERNDLLRQARRP